MSKSGACDSRPRVPSTTEPRCIPSTVDYSQHCMGCSRLPLLPRASPKELPLAPTPQQCASILLHRDHVSSHRLAVRATVLTTAAYPSRRGWFLSCEA